MRIMLTAVVLSVATAAWAQSEPVSPKDTPEAYWSRGYGCGQSAENYNMSLRVDNIDAAASKIDAVMTAAGAPSQVGQNNGYYAGQNRGRQMNYSIPLKAADKLTKRLMDQGELMNFSMNRQSTVDNLKQIEERISVIENELKNADALSKMPTAAYFLRSRLGQLKQSRDGCAAGASKAQVSINLQSKPADGK